jgi:chemotaxis protein CheD
MNSPDHGDLPQIILKPGELFTTNQPTLVSTVLGSCVSITMFSQQLRIAAICHAVLPQDKGREGDEIFRYVDRSLEAMLEHFHRNGISGKAIELKLFGGADMLVARNDQLWSIGKQNIDMAKKLIEEKNLTVNANDLGGNQGRKLLFKTHTGEVFLKRLRANSHRDHGYYVQLPRKQR